MGAEIEDEDPRRKVRAAFEEQDMSHFEFAAGETEMISSSELQGSPFRFRSCD
jgi:hypothetical protein